MSIFDNKIMRAVGMFIVAATGIGLIYMLARMRFVEPGNVGIVANYDTGINEVYPPGWHCIISPARSFINEMPGPDKEIFASQTVTLHTADNIETRAKVDIRYKINNAQDAVTKIQNNYQEALLKATETSLSSMIREENITFQRLSSQRLSPFNLLQNKGTDSEVPAEVCDYKTPSNKNSNLLGQLTITLLEKINQLANSWGITVLGIQIVNMTATHIEQEIENTSKAQFTAVNKMLSVKNEQQTKNIEAETNALVQNRKSVADAQAVETEADAYARAAVVRAKGDAEALRIRTKAEQDRINHFSREFKMPASEVFNNDTRIKIAEALAQTKGTLVLDKQVAPSSFFALRPENSKTNEFTSALEVDHGLS